MVVERRRASEVARVERWTMGMGFVVLDVGLKFDVE